MANHGVSTETPFERQQRLSLQAEIIDALAPFFPGMENRDIPDESSHEPPYSIYCTFSQLIQKQIPQPIVIISPSMLLHWGRMSATERLEAVRGRGPLPGDGKRPFAFEQMQYIVAIDDINVGVHFFVHVDDGPILEVSDPTGSLQRVSLRTPWGEERSGVVAEDVFEIEIPPYTLQCTVKITTKDGVSAEFDIQISNDA